MLKMAFLHCWYTVRSTENPWLECGVVVDVVPCNRYIYTLLTRHLIVLSILRKKILASKLFYSASGCASSDVSGRLESESLSRPHSLDACAATLIGSKR
jgi:hypothetical protein